MPFIRNLSKTSFIQSHSIRLLTKSDTSLSRSMARTEFDIRKDIPQLMADWINSLPGWLQFGANIVALIGGAVIWKQYVNKLKAALTAKEAEISTANAHRDFWKDKAEELEKRSPETLEQALTSRVKAHQEEIERLSADKEANAEAIENLKDEKYTLEKDLARTRGFRLMLAIEEEDELLEEFDDVPINLDDEQEVTIDVVPLGEVAVDSGQLMITDPCYIDNEWQAPSLTDEEWWNKQTPGHHQDEVSRRKDEEKKLAPYSYRGAAQATLLGQYGELAFKLGHAGAGVAFSTAWGDGIYPVYGEMHNGRIVRVYITTG